MSDERFEVQTLPEGEHIGMSGMKFWSPLPKYRCPKHGEVEDIIQSHIKGLEGVWCQHCLIEMLSEKLPKLERVETP